MTLKQMNNEMKSFINEATFIGERCRKKFLKLVDKHFFVELPKESFLHTDIILKENGNIVIYADKLVRNNKSEWNFPKRYKVSITEEDLKKN